MTSLDPSRFSRRASVFLMTLALLLTVLVVGIAKLLILLIAFFTNLFYRGEISFHEGAPDPAHWGWASIAVPVLGGLIVGAMARFGSKGIRGHGIPEAMESILIRESRIPKRLTILKPLSSAIAIGSGGPFGAEGPIIATGGALGSLLGQLIHVGETGRKILLASGAAAGMTAIFGTPMSAVLLSIELLLFEFKPSSFIPVALCAALANVLRGTLLGWEKPFFEMPTLGAVAPNELFILLAFGALIGLISVFVIKSVYWIEDMFEKLPLPWALWPALGGLIVGLIGMVEPRTLGVGYVNITSALNGQMPLALAFSLLTLKFVSWSTALGSGTSGGTLAPIMTLGAALGLLFYMALKALMPELEFEPAVFALVGMAGLFAGCSRATLASVLFAFEATRQPLSLAPLLLTCAASAWVSREFCADSIMTLKIVRRGIYVPHEYAAQLQRETPQT